MKLLPLILTLSTLTAQAGTIDLQPATCGAGFWCSTVPNTSSDSVLFYGSTNYHSAGLILGQPDGSYLDFNGSASISGTCPPAPAVGTIQVAASMPGINGATGVATVTATFSCTAHLGGSGRGQSFHPVWNLVSGQVVTP